MSATLTRSTSFTREGPTVRVTPSPAVWPRPVPVQCKAVWKQPDSGPFARGTKRRLRNPKPQSNLYSRQARLFSASKLVPLAPTLQINGYDGLSRAQVREPGRFPASWSPNERLHCWFRWMLVQCSCAICSQRTFLSTSSTLVTKGSPGQFERRVSWRPGLG